LADLGTSDQHPVAMTRRPDSLPSPDKPAGTVNDAMPFELQGRQRRHGDGFPERP